ncbi:TRAPP subunit BET5 [Sporobolomyces salmoneus]|uniref:TRAPP subunit BET5 n=1 Tax=Sporobolomyces salmoneus TaxID=183962 RepID=UPI00317BAF0C
MVVYGLYIFDKHCTCTFYTSPSPVPSTSTSAPPTALDLQNGPHARKEPGPTTLPGVLPPLAAPLIRDSLQLGEQEGLPNGEGEAVIKSNRLAFDEEAKLVYGVVFSLRNMVKKLSSRESDSFHSFSTSTYKLHSLSTPTQFHFVLLTSPTPTSHRPLLRSLYTGPFNEYVVRNPLIDLDTRIGGKGIGNEKFRREVDRMLLTSGV